MLKLCGMEMKIVYFIIGEIFKMLEGFFVKKIGDFY